MKKFRYLLIAVFLIAPIAGKAQTWKLSTNLPNGGTDGMFGFAIGDKMYMGGGSYNKSFWEFDPATEKWTKKADVPNTHSARSFGVGFAIGNFGYVTTGQDDDDQSKVFNDLWQYDPSTDKWTRKADLPGVARDGAVGFAVAGKGYVGGGSDAKYNYPSDFYSYDPTTDKWTKENDLPTGPPMYQPNIIFPATFVIGNYAYMATGSVNNLETRDLYRYDPSADTWAKKAPLPDSARQAATGFSLYGKGYVGLGMVGYDSSRVYRTMLSYDPVTDQWTRIADFPGTKRAWALSISNNSSAFVGGGWNLGPSFFNGWWRFDTVTAITTKPGFLTINQPHLYFGAHTYGSDTTTSAFLLNQSWKAIGIDSVTITGTDASSFSLAPSTIHYPYLLGNGPDSLAVNVTFNPSAPSGNKTALLKIYYDEVADSIQQVYLIAISQPVESVAAEASEQFDVAPNPIRDRATVSFTSANAGETRIELIDLLGRTVYQSPKTIVARGESVRIPIDASALNLQSGTYMLRAITAGKTTEAKIVVNR